MKNILCCLLVWVGVLYSQSNSDELAGRELEFATHADSLWLKIAYANKLDESQMVLFKDRQAVDISIFRINCLMSDSNIIEEGFDSLYIVYNKSAQKYFSHNQQRSNQRINVANGPCTNIDFENGTTSGWTGILADACSTSAFGCNRAVGFSATRHVITNKSMVDPFIPGLSTVSPTGNYSLLLEDYKNGTEVGTKGNVSILKQTFKVTATNNLFTYQYATVLEDPGDHGDEERPYFKIRLFDSIGNVIPCASYTVIAKPPLTSFRNVKVNNPNRAGGGGPGGGGNNMMDLYYRDWTLVSVPLTGYIGQNVSIEFTVSDCSRGGHMGYTYLDANCAAIKPPQDTTICGTTAKKILTSNGFATYSWSGPGIVSGGNTKEVTVNRPGKYTVTLTPFSDDPCPIIQTYIITQVCPSPVLTATFCESVKGTLKKDNINLASINNSVIGTRTGLKVLSWHTAKPATIANKITNINSVSSLNAAKFYAVTDMPDTVQLTITVNPSPNVTFAAIDTLCKSNIAKQIAGVSPLGGVFSGINVTSAGILTPNQVGIFAIKYVSTNTFGCKDSSTKPVVVVAPATVVVSNVSPICSTTDSVVVKSTSTNATKVTWRGGLGTFKNSQQNNTIYYLSASEKQVAGNVSLMVEATAVSPCPQVKDTVVFNIVPEAQLQLPTNVTICATTDTLTIVAASKNVSNISWASNAGTITKLSNEKALLKTTGVGSVISVVAQGIALAPCTNARDTLLVQFVAPALVTIDPVAPICASTDSISLSSVVINAPKVRWTAGNGVLVNKDSVKTMYKLTTNDKKLKQLKFYLEAFSESPCKNVYDTIAVQVVPTPTLTLPDSIKLCSNQASTSINAHIVNYQSVSWFSNLGSLQKTNDSMVVLNKAAITQNIQIIAQAFGMVPCASISDTTLIQTVQLPIVQIAPSGSICSNNDSIVLVGTANNYKSLNWSGGLGSFSTGSILKTRYQAASAEIAGANIKIILTAEAFLPCPNASDTTILKLLPSPSTKTLELYFCKESDHSVMLTADKGVKYNWNSGELTQSIDVVEPNQYSVTLINEFGCEAKQIFSLEDICPPRLFVPNAFSPNGDGINDKFTVFGAHIGKYEFLIFNRWGEVIFRSTNMNDTWDGTYRDELMPIGVYEWLVNYEGDSQKYRGPYQKKGSVTLIK